MLTFYVSAGSRFKKEMWDMIAKEMSLPWRAVESMHWQMGAEEMAQRANVAVFQTHVPSSSLPKNPSGSSIMGSSSSKRKASSKSPTLGGGGASDSSAAGSGGAPLSESGMGQSSS